MAIKSCGSCRYFTRWKDTKGYGLCDMYDLKTTAQHNARFCNGHKKIAYTRRVKHKKE